LRIGDIVGTTSGAPIACAIHWRLWGWRNMFRQDLPNHIAIVVNRSHGLLYLAEMLGKGIALTEIHEYEQRAPLQHVCFVGRHAALNEASTQVKLNNYLLEAHARKVKYGYEGLLLFLNLKVKDDPARLICSELAREAFRIARIPFPRPWEENCSPRDWWEWIELHNITKEVLV
jgi:hypothetical protein